MAFLGAAVTVVVISGASLLCSIFDMGSCFSPGTLLLRRTPFCCAPLMDSVCVEASFFSTTPVIVVLTTTRSIPAACSFVGFCNEGPLPSLLTTGIFFDFSSPPNGTFSCATKSTTKSCLTHDDGLDFVLPVSEFFDDDDETLLFGFDFTFFITFTVFFNVDAVFFTATTSATDFFFVLMSATSVFFTGIFF